MTNLGLWGPFIDEREMFRWYRLPDVQRAEAQAYHPDGREMDPLTPQQYAELHRRTVQYAQQSVAPFSPPYHNDTTHFAVVEMHGTAAMGAYAAGKGLRLPALVRQVFPLALRLHDAHHCAATLRSMAPRGVYRRDLGLDVASEWVTALAIDEFMRGQRLNLPARLFQTSVIWSSTFGGQTSRGRRLRIPDPRPQTVWGAIMRASDVCPPNTFRAWIRQSMAVNYGEIPPELAPHTLREFTVHSEGFVEYIDSCFNELDRISGLPLTTTLDWQGNLATIRRGLALLKSRESRTVGFVRAEAQRYNVQLG